jgi:signal peptidase I
MTSIGKIIVAVDSQSREKLVNYNLYKDGSEKKKSPLWLKIVGGFFGVIFMAFMGFVFYLNVFLEYHEVKGGSMFPTLNGDARDEDYVYSSVTKDVTYGDIIIYRASDDENEQERLVIKRLIGLGGDCIKVRDTQILDDEGYLIFEVLIRYKGTTEWVVLDDSYISSRATNYALHEKLYNRNVHNKILIEEDDGSRYLEVPEGHFFAIGDNRVTSYDCATYGPLPLDRIHGKVEFVIYDNNLPVFQALGQLFGDKKWK